MSTEKPQQTERPPIVVVMGHVDHGKSTLLDYIRKTNTVEKEAGGITQHVAAYEVEREKSGEKKRITFIDTPGHAAFSAIRARGANVADIAILVVAADEGVKAQTREALTVIHEAKIPFIVAITKIDKPTSSIERAQTSLLEHGVYLEKLGGDVPWVTTSGKTGAGIDELLDLILIVAELHGYYANPSALASGYIIETHRDKKRGIAATLIITNGTLSVGMAVLAGRTIAPVRILENMNGKALTKASFSTPVQLIGFDDLPDVGADFTSFKNKRDAEEARAALPPLPSPRDTAAHATPDESERFYLPVIVRADTAGSLDAILHELTRIGDEQSGISILQSGIGNITEGDVKTALAGTIVATIVGFNVDVDPIAENKARSSGVPIERFDIIYKLTERLEEILRVTKPKRQVEEVIGRAKILKNFSSHKNIRVVGGSVQEGYFQKGAMLRISRRGTLIGTAKIRNLQTNKADVQRVDTGSEFGAQIESVFEIAQGDVAECFIIAVK